MTERTKTKKRALVAEKAADPRTSWELYLKTTESSTGGEPEGNEQWCSHSDIVAIVSFDSVSRSKDQSFWGCGSGFDVSEEVWNSEKVYLVIPRYSDGGTFGRTTGLWCIQGAYTSEAPALALARAIRGGTVKTEYPEMDCKYLPWEGHFASLQNVEVHCFTIREASSDSREGDPSVHYH